MVSLAGCGDDEASGPSAPATTTSRTAASDYVLHAGEPWLLDEITDPVPHDHPELALFPDMRWRADYVTATSPSNDDRVMVTMHATDLGDLKESPLIQEYNLQPVEIGSWAGFAGTTPGAPGNPPAVLLAAGDHHTILAYTYGLNLDELIDWMADLRPVSDDEWKDARASSLVEATPDEVMTGYQPPEVFTLDREERADDDDEQQLSHVYSTSLTPGEACEALRTSFESWPSPHEFDWFGVEQDVEGTTYSYCGIQGSTAGHFVSGGVFPTDGEVPPSAEPTAVEVVVTTSG